MDAGFEIMKISPFEDYRGQLKKIVQKSKLDNGTEIEEIYVLYSNKDTVRGNHYHKETIEYFTILSGEATMAFWDIEEEHLEVIPLKAADNITIKVNPNTVHAFKNVSLEPLIVLAVSLKEYNPQDNDTYIYKLLD